MRKKKIMCYLQVIGMVILSGIALKGLAVDQDTLTWGINKIDIEYVWGRQEGANDVQNSYYAGQGIKVAILDSGIDTQHYDLDDNYKGGYDFVYDDSDPMDDHGHGTQVAGVLAAEDNGQGVIGVAPHVELYAVKVLKTVMGFPGIVDISHVVDGIEWAINHDMDIISMSFGIPENELNNIDPEGSFEAVCNDAYNNHGILLVAAVGNSNKNEIYCPAKFSSVIAVGATCENDSRANFSHYGTELELTAPGHNIYTTTLDGGHVTTFGTSFATPMVTGTIACMWSINPKLTATSIRANLRDNAKDLGNAGKDDYYGYGRIQSLVSVEDIDKYSKLNLYTSDYGDGSGRIYAKTWYSNYPSFVYKIEIKYGWTTNSLTEGGSKIINYQFFGSHSYAVTHTGPIYYRVRVYKDNSHVIIDSYVKSFIITDEGGGGGSGPF